MSKTINQVQEAMKLILSIDWSAQVKVVETEWCRGFNDYVYVYDGDDWYESFTGGKYSESELIGGTMLMLDDHSHCGGYTSILPNDLEITYDEFKDRYSQGSLL